MFVFPWIPACLPGSTHFCIQKHYSQFMHKFPPNQRLIISSSVFIIIDWLAHQISLFKHVLE